MKKRLLEIQARKREMVEELENATEARMAELEKELDQLEAEERELTRKLNIRGRLKEPEEKPEGRENLTPREERAAAFMESNRTSVNARAMLVSGGQIATPTGVSENLNDIYGDVVSSLVDMVYVEDCTGMGTHTVPYVTSELTAGDGTEGQTPATSDLRTDKVDLTPKEINTLSYVSKQIKKQTSVQYEMKVVTSARNALRKKANEKIVKAIYGSNITKTLEVEGNKIEAGTLRKIAMNYGGDETVGGGVLILNKADLIAFGDVRGEKEKKAVYEITPDAGNENTGTIKDGGLVVRYVLNKNCNPMTDNTGTKGTMIYGNPKFCELDVWGDYEITTSEDYKFAEGLLSVRGEVLADAAVIAKNGFVVVKTKTTT